MQSLSTSFVSRITFSSAGQDDEGLYECVAINVLGIVSSNITVIVTNEGMYVHHVHLYILENNNMLCGQIKGTSSVHKLPCYLPGIRTPNCTALYVY